MRAPADMNAEKAEIIRRAVEDDDGFTDTLLALRARRKAWKEAQRVIGGDDVGPRIRDFVRHKINFYGEAIRAVVSIAYAVDTAQHNQPKGTSENGQV